MDHGIFNVHTYVNAFDSRTGVYGHALKVDSGRKIPCRTGESNLCRRRAGPMLYQLSYIPIPTMRDLWFSVLLALRLSFTSTWN